MIKRRFGALSAVYEGEILGKHVRNQRGSILEIETEDFVTDSEMASMQSPNWHGAYAASNDISGLRNRPVKLTKLARDGVVAGPPFLCLTTAATLRFFVRPTAPAPSMRSQLHASVRPQ